MTASCPGPNSARGFYVFSEASFCLAWICSSHHVLLAQFPSFLPFSKYSPHRGSIRSARSQNRCPECPEPPLRALLPAGDCRLRLRRGLHRSPAPTSCFFALLLWRPRCVFQALRGPGCVEANEFGASGDAFLALPTLAGPRGGRSVARGGRRRCSGPVRVWRWRGTCCCASLSPRLTGISVPPLVCGGRLLVPGRGSLAGPDPAVVRSE